MNGSVNFAASLKTSQRAFARTSSQTFAIRQSYSQIPSFVK